eukprot:TRINITY_DN102967_c0_g1_i1.p1 TRINITY_DN102967_c0_g1~~TRINITY_DN102967_c0_g1_i1.p1  ORF type:complete len:475 (+),score=117.09 TRINITY_DN102967_c0_g1_i1:133-1557(+)
MNEDVPNGPPISPIHTRPRPKTLKRSMTMTPSSPTLAEASKPLSQSLKSPLARTQSFRPQSSLRKPDFPSSGTPGFLRETVASKSSKQSCLLKRSNTLNNFELKFPSLKLNGREQAKGSFTERPVFSLDGSWISPKHLSKTSQQTARQRSLMAKFGGDPDVPGPGEYSVPSEQVHGLFGRFNESKPKNDVDWKIYHASKIPGPADYPAPQLRGPSGGTFSAAFPKTSIEQYMYNNRHGPGPAAHDIPEAPEPGGGRFNMSNPKNDVEWKMYHAAQLPGPGTYQPKSIDKGPSYSIKGKILKGNHQTTLQNSITLAHSTLPVGPTQCRTDGALGKQVSSEQPSAPSFSFGPPRDDELLKSLKITKKKRKKAPRKLNKEEPKMNGLTQAEYARFFGYIPGKDAVSNSLTATRRLKTPKRRPKSAAALSRKGVTGSRNMPGLIDKKKTPGPGSYQIPSTICKSPVHKSSPSFSFGTD